MNSIVAASPFLIPMAVLIFLSGFFSASEAALFSLRRQERRLLAKGNLAQQTAANLLQDPDRLLSAILFWNLVGLMFYYMQVTMTPEVMAENFNEAQQEWMNSEPVWALVKAAMSSVE